MSIAREGETEYASIHRNRSGQDAGNLDYGIAVEAVEKLSEVEKRELVAVAYLLARNLREYCT